ncbi:hypothetical protein COB52_01930 [Candidatus Kaiserbacteria bacterium]|nr:MAG: hypothetical protein COB52_01930 [Candidatus Kaiserbacteria bacterium]
MLDTLKQNKIILVILIVIIAALGWFGLSGNQTTSSLLTNDSRSSGNVVVDQDILRLLLDMRSIQLDSSIFENPAFGKLQDFGKQIIPEPVGRDNPFLPSNESFEGDVSANDPFQE